jgi:hypothetical protein
MISSNNCPPPRNSTDPCTAVLPDCNNVNSQTTNNRFGKKSGYYRSSNCYRPLQQLYKTMYSPAGGNNSSRMDFACICQPAERYKTANMTYGSFHYNNWAFMQKNRPINYDRALFERCYDNNKKQQSKCDNRSNKYELHFFR